MNPRMLKLIQAMSNIFEKNKAMINHVQENEQFVSKMLGRYLETSQMISNSMLLYNKMFMAKTIFPEPLSTDLISFLGYNDNVDRAKKLIDENFTELEEFREYYRSIFTKSIYDVCAQHEIDHSWPQEILR